jgi:hypothetical protein
MSKSKFEVGDVIVSPKNVVYDVIDMPTHCPVLGITEAKGSLLVLKCRGCELHKVPSTHRVGIFDGASVYFNNLYFKKV